MRLTNHIAWRFLNDENLLWEIMELIHPTLMKDAEENNIPDYAAFTWNLLSTQNNVNYYVTKSVIDKFDLLKIHRNENGWYDYKFFSMIKPCKKTFIFPDNKLVRFVATETQFIFNYIRMDMDKTNPDVPEAMRKYWGHMNNCLWFVEREDGKPCTHYGHSDVREMEEYIYKFLCFMYLSEIEEVILKPNQSTGTKKTGKVLNELKHDLIIVNNNWNVTSINTTGFAVSGHYRLQPCGPEHSQRTIIWIDPFEKKGYVRSAKKESVI